MRLSKDAVLFSFHGIPILGSKKTGDVIGLTSEAARLCEVMRHKDLPHEDVNEVDPHLEDALTQGSFLEDENGVALAESHQVMAYVHVTQRCNLACYGCYSDDERRNRLRDAPRSDFATAFQKLASIGTREIIVSGGEPFLRDDLSSLCKDAKTAGVCHITVISNGTLITERAIDAVAPYVDCISISFDGTSADSPAYIRGEQRFNDLVRAVELVRRAGVRAHMIPTIHSRNIDDIPAYLDLSNRLGATLNFSVLIYSFCHFSRSGRALFL